MEKNKLDRRYLFSQLFLIHEDTYKPTRFLRYFTYINLITSMLFLDAFYIYFLINDFQKTKTIILPYLFLTFLSSLISWGFDSFYFYKKYQGKIRSLFLGFAGYLTLVYWALAWFFIEKNISPIQKENYGFKKDDFFAKQIDNFNFFKIGFIDFLKTDLAYFTLIYSVIIIFILFMCFIRTILSFGSESMRDNMVRIIFILTKFVLVIKTIFVLLVINLIV